MTPVKKFLAIIGLIRLTSTKPYDDGCIPGSEGCDPPYPPGHQNMGPSWWAIGRQEGGVYFHSVDTHLLVPAIPTEFSGARAINPALENTVSEATSPKLGHLTPTFYRYSSHG